MIRSNIKRWLAENWPRSSEALDRAVWDHSHNWESWAGGEVDFWWDQPDSEQLMAVAKLSETDPVAAFQGYRELAEKGCVHAMIWLGNCHRYGLGTEPNYDQAHDSYSLAIAEGSWIATRDIAGLLFDNGNFAECEKYLEEGIQCDFIPAYFWLAWYRIARSNTQDTFDQARPLLEHAAAEGHPHAEKYLAALLAKGKFGIREIPRGMTLLRDALRRFTEYEEAEEK
jgi:TPR repeat protein